MKRSRDESEVGNKEVGGGAVGRPPVYSRKLGFLQLSIWLREVDPMRRFFSVSITRRYQHEGKWRESSSFSAADIDAVLFLLKDAQTWLERHERRDVEDDVHG